MTWLPRRSAAYLLIAVGLCVALPEGAHRHGLGELDLVAHELWAAASAASCLPVAHLDRAQALEHPSCSACVLASLAWGGDETPSAPTEPPPATVRVVASAAGPGSPVVTTARGRAPPLPA